MRWLMSALEATLFATLSAFLQSIAQVIENRIQCPGKLGKNPSVSILPAGFIAVNQRVI
jgi:hypothetical protein